jgi:outer membrane protein assembly factor BamA
MKKNTIFVFYIVSLFISSLLAQEHQDSLKLPFAIAKEKKLPEEELQNKKEGIYVTGAPDFSSDPVNGFGYGGEGTLFFNGKKSDPFFAYTAYRTRLDLTLFNTTKNQREFMLKLDVPYIFNTRWRLRVEGGYEANPNLLYFGINENSLNGLHYYPGNDSTQTPLQNISYSEYEKSLTGNNQFYNNYFKKEGVINLSMERSYLEGKLRLLIGYEFAHVNMSVFNGNSLVRQDSDKGLLLGLKTGNVQIYQLGVIYDTRDLETDPSNGVFAEITNELSLKSLGSSYNFNKTFGHVNYYRKQLPKQFKRMIFAGRMAFGYTALDAPFFEYQDQWSSEGSIEGLGGTNTLRGYKQSRFLARAMLFSNVELRYRIAQTKILKQHLAFSLVPFFDVGGVWNTLSRVSNLSDLRYSEGVGFRIAWNMNTIIRLDYAFSKEDRQFFLSLSHTF